MTFLPERKERCKLLLLTLLLLLGLPHSRTVQADSSGLETRLEKVSKTASSKLKKFSRAAAYYAEGIASYYGRAFHGRKTASGDVFNMHALTAAHKTLPLNSLVRVTNLDNGLSVIVRVTDRGPYHGNRLIDLSYGAAKKLGMLRKGTAKVELTRIRPDDLPQKAPAISPLTPVMASLKGYAAPQLYVGIAEFGNQAAADHLVAELRQAGIMPVAAKETQGRSNPRYLVRLGPLDTISEAAHWKSRLNEQGLADAQIIEENTGPVPQDDDMPRTSRPSLMEALLRNP